MAAERNLYVLSSGADETEEWVSPRPIDGVVFDRLTDATELSIDDLDGLDAYVDRADLAAYLEGEPAADALTFAVEGHDVIVEPDGTVDVDIA